MIKKSPLVRFFSPLTWAFLSMIGIALVGGFVLFSTQRLSVSQDLRQQASTGDAGPVTFRFRADKTTVSKGQTVVVDVMMNTGTQGISGVSLEGQLKQVATALTLSNTSESGLSTVYSDQDLQGTQINWQAIVFAALSNGQLYSSNNREVIVASLVIKPSAVGTLIVTADAEVTGINPPQTQITIIPQASVTVTEVQASNPPDQGIHRSCNEYCADSRECASQFTCYYNRCRNPLNINNDQCQNPPTPAPVQPRGGVPANTPKPKTPPTATITDITSKPLVTAPPASTVSVDGKNSTKSGSTASPRPTPTPTPRPTPSPSAQPTPTPEESQTEQPKKGANVFLIALLVTLLIGGIGGLAYVFLKYRG